MATVPLQLPVGGRALLGLLGQYELVNFETTSSLTLLAPQLSDRIVVVELVSTQFARFNRISEQVRAHGWQVDATMEPFREALDGFAGATPAHDWPTAQLRALLVNGLRSDFSERISQGLAKPLAELIAPGPVAWRIADFAHRTLGAALADDPDLAGGLALFGRRLAAEALGQCQRIASKEVELTSLVSAAMAAGEGAEQPDHSDDLTSLGAVSRLLEELMEGHSARMARLGLGS